MLASRLVLLPAAIASITAIVMVAWGGAPAPRASSYVPPRGGPPTAELGARLFETKGCAQCHSIDGSPRVGPSLAGMYGTRVALADGDVLADERYLRESITSPRAKTRAGFQPVMPAFDGLLRDREVTALVAYIKSLR